MLEGLPYLQLKHGLMEFEYTANYNPVQTPQFSHLLDSQEPDHLDFEISSQPTAAGVMHDEDFGVAMTASMDPSGHLLLGLVHTRVGGGGVLEITPNPCGINPGIKVDNHGYQKNQMPNFIYI